MPFQLLIYDLNDKSSRKSLRISEKFSMETPLYYYPSRFVRFKETIYWKVIGAVILVLSVLGASTIGTISNFVPANGPFLKNTWRSGVLILYFVVPSLLEIINLIRKNYQSSYIEKHQGMDVRTYLTIVGSSLTQLMW